MYEYVISKGWDKITKIEQQPWGGKTCSITIMIAQLLMCSSKTNEHNPQCDNSKSIEIMNERGCENIMRFNSINIYSGEEHDGVRKKEITGFLRSESDKVCILYLQILKYYNNKQCKSLNISCDENADFIYIESLWEGYPVLHYPFNLTQYLLLDSQTQNKYWLEVIHQSINYICDLWGWDLQFFDDVYNKAYLNL